MELKITKLFNSPEFRPAYYSASAAELGNDAGAITWENAKDATEESPILTTSEEFDAARSFIRSSGGWSDEEVSAMSETDLNALILQWISGDAREFFELADGNWQTWQELQEKGTVSGNLFGGPLSTDGGVYFSMEA